MLSRARRRPSGSLLRKALPGCTCFHTRPPLAFQSQPKEHSSAPPVHTSHSDAALREVFDSPSPRGSAHPTTPTGLFGQPALTTPESFLHVARRTTLRAKFIVARICAERTPPASIEEAELAFLAMVKNLDRLSDLLCGIIDLAEMVRNVHPDEDWNEGANEAYEEMLGYMNELNTHVGLYESLKSLHTLLPASTPTKSPELFAAFAVAVPFLRDFEKSGIHLPSADRTKFVDLSNDITVLGRKFLQNAGELRSPVQVSAGEVEAGMGSGFARKLFGQSGKKKFVDPLSWEGRVLARQHPDGEVRKRLYVAANAAPESHVETLEELLRTRGELAQLVGRETWGDVALEDKMAKTPENVMSFLTSLNEHNRPLALKDLALLKKAKSQHLGTTVSTTTINAWDRDFYSDLAGSATSATPDISPFFSVGTCFQGLSRLFSSLYGIRFEVEDVLPGETWQPEVRKLRVIDDEEGEIGTIYCDLFAREGKQAGAAHYTVRCHRRLDDDDAEGDFGPNGVAVLEGVEVQRKDIEGLQVVPVSHQGKSGTYQDPVIVLVCGFGGIQGGNIGQGPAFLQWYEVETLFHEMGHAIHSMIGRTDYHNVAGTRCATDFVELPSILMEHFISSPSVVALFSSHHRTGRPLPPSILSSLLSERQHFSALETSTQIMMAALDQSYHSTPPLSPSFSSTDILRRTHGEFNVIPHAEGTALQTQFGHFFGYGATYYAYLFDRAIAAKVFGELFKKDPLGREGGERFKREVLRWGGGKEPWEMVGEVVGSEVVKRGGRGAMAEVGKWGIEESKRGN